MDQKVIKIFEQRDILLKNLRSLDMSEATKSRSYSGYFGINLDGFYQIILIRNAKSKILKKDYLLLNEICSKFEIKFNTSIKKRILFYNSAICKKVIKEFKDNGWKCYDFM